MVERGFDTLSGVSRTVVGLAAGVVSAAVAVHAGVVFLHVAPPNVISREHAPAIDRYVRPEFQQNWKLFAPDPLHVQRTIYARARLRTSGGDVRVTGWIDLTAADIEQTRGSLVPSHTRNQLSKGWRAFLATHDDRNRPRSPAGPIIVAYLKRVALRRLSERIPPYAIQRIQLRATTVRVPEPSWSSRTTDRSAYHRVLPWLRVTPRDVPGGAGGR